MERRVSSVKWRCVSTSGEACLVGEVEVRFNEWRGVSRRVEDARFEARCNWRDL